MSETEKSMSEAPWRLLELNDAEQTSAVDDLAAALSRVDEARVAPGAAEDFRDEIRDFCNRHDNALHRHSLTGHLTGSGFVVDPTRRRVLLIHHRKLDLWLQPGGHADGQGDLALVALTEAIEETGLEGLRVVVPAMDIDVHAIPEHGDVPAHRHLDVRYLVLASPDTEPDADSRETLGAAWFDLDDQRTFDDLQLGRLARQARLVLDEMIELGLLDAPSSGLSEG